MNFCPQCGKQLDPSCQFCSNCGHPANADFVAPPVMPAQSYYQPQNTYSYYNAEPQIEVSGKDKAMGFVGMGLGIGGLVFAVLGLLYTFIGLIEEIPEMTIAFAIAFGFFSMPLSILGRKFANDSLDAGNTSGAATAGSRVGLAGLIVSIVMLFFGFIGLTMM